MRKKTQWSKRIELNLLNFYVCFVVLVHFAQFLLTSAAEKEKTLRSAHSLYNLRICAYKWGRSDKYTDLPLYSATIAREI